MGVCAFGKNKEHRQKINAEQYLKMMLDFIYKV